MKKLLLRANCPTNEYWDVDYFYVELTPELITRLIAMGEAAIAFLKSQATAWGHVSLADPTGFEVYATEHDGDLSSGALLDATSGDCLVLAEAQRGFDPGDNSARTELHSIKIFIDGSIYLEALSKDGGDHVEAELPSELLTDGVSP